MEARDVIELILGGAPDTVPNQHRGRDVDFDVDLLDVVCNGDDLSLMGKLRGGMGGSCPALIKGQDDGGKGK